MAPPPARRWKSTASAEARGAPAGTGEAARPDAVGNLLQRSGAVGARIVFIGDQPIQRPVFGVGGKLRFMHYRTSCFGASRSHGCGKEAISAGKSLRRNLLPGGGKARRRRCAWR